MLLSCRHCQEVSESQDEYDPVGRPQMVLSALQQATGEAMYNDDLPRIEGKTLISILPSKPTLFYRTRSFIINSNLKCAKRFEIYRTFTEGSWGPLLREKSFIHQGPRNNFEVVG